jgi:hypothetical protein
MLPEQGDDPGGDKALGASNRYGILEIALEQFWVEMQHEMSQHARFYWLY